MLRIRLGFALAAVAFATYAGAVTACGSFSNGALAGTSSGGENDAGTDAGGPDGFSGGDAGDAGTDAVTDAAGVPPPGALFVHGSPDLPDLRFCWTVGSDGPSPTDRAYPFAAPMPASNYPGVPVGGGVGLGDASSMLGGPLTIYAIDARAIANVERFTSNCAGNTCSCAAIMNTNSGGVDMTAIHQMPPIPAGAILPGSTAVLSVRGCYGTAYDPNATAQRCGADWTSAAGNLKVDVTSIPGASLPAPDGGVLAVQAAQLSPALAALAGDAGAVVSFGAQGAADASVIATLGSLDQILPSAPQQVANAIALSSFGQLGFAVDVAGIGDAGGGAHLWMSLAQSLELVDPTQSPSQYYAQPTSYLVTVVGNPAGAPPGSTGDASYDGTGLHLLVLSLP